MANELEHHRLPTAAEGRLRGLALDGSRVELSDSLDAVVILAQPRFMIVDLLALPAWTTRRRVSSFPS